MVSRLIGAITQRDYKARADKLAGEGLTEQAFNFAGVIIHEIFADYHQFSCAQDITDNDFYALNLCLAIRRQYRAMRDVTRMNERKIER